MTSAPNARVTRGSVQGAIFVPDCAPESRLRCPREAACDPAARQVLTEHADNARAPQSLAAPDRSMWAPIRSSRPFRTCATWVGVRSPNATYPWDRDTTWLASKGRDRTHSLHH